MFRNCLREAGQILSLWAENELNMWGNYCYTVATIDGGVAAATTEELSVVHKKSDSEITT